VLSKSNTLA
jgi:hypothetical protein